MVKGKMNYEIECPVCKRLIVIKKESIERPSGFGKVVAIWCLGCQVFYPIRFVGNDYGRKGE